MTPPQRVSLDDFLARLDETAAAEARVAAARIDELARVGDAMEGIERRFMPWFIGSGVLFVVSLYLFFSPGIVPRLVTILCMGALPAVSVIYGLRVMPRSRADRAAEELNVAHFLPYGGLYFPPGDNPACVVRVPSQTDGPDRPGVTRRDIWW